MKKFIFYIMFLFLFSCQRPTYSYFKSEDIQSNDTLSISTSSNDEENITSEETNSYITSDSIESSEEDDDFKLIVESPHHVIFKYKTKSVDYFVDHLIDGITYTFDENIYINENRNEIGFLVINKGKLYFDETTLVKKGDAYEPRNALQYGKNSLITIIGEAYVEVNKCAINIFSKGSSFIHLMHGGSAIINSVDVVVSDEYSCVYSYYNALELVNAKNCFVFIDNEKSEECVTFYDE